MPVNKDVSQNLLAHHDGSGSGLSWKTIFVWFPFESMLVGFHAHVVVVMFVFVIVVVVGSWCLPSPYSPSFNNLLRNP